MSAISRPWRNRRRATLDLDTPRPFADRLRSPDGPSVIAEIKRRSPSKGPLAPDLDARGSFPCLRLRRRRLSLGAHRRPSFRRLGGRPRGGTVGVGTPRAPQGLHGHLRGNLYDARLMGADAVLLIVAALSDEELRRFVKLAGSLRLAALVEVHDLDEADRAVAAGAQLVGVNQRDLRTFEVDNGPRRSSGSRPPRRYGQGRRVGDQLPRRRRPPRRRRLRRRAGGKCSCEVHILQTPCEHFGLPSTSAPEGSGQPADVVKICGVTSEEDALIAVAMGADRGRLMFAPSPRQMSPSAVQAIVRRAATRDRHRRGVS